MKKKSSTPANRVPNLFIEKHQKHVMGILHSFDRLRLQGSLRYLYCSKVFEESEQSQGVVQRLQAVCHATDQRSVPECRATGQSRKRPFTYLSSSALSKEELARKIAERDGIKEGLVAIFRCVEPCRTYKMRGNYQTKRLKPHAAAYGPNHQRLRTLKAKYAPTNLFRLNQDIRPA